MQADYELTSDDVVAFVTFHHRQSPTARRVRLGCGFLGFALLCVLPAAILVTTDEPLSATALAIWPLLLAPAIFPFVVILFYRWTLQQTTRSMLAEGESRGYFGPCSLQIVTEGIIETKPDGQTLRKWASVQRIVVTEDHVFIYTSPVEAFIAPKRAFDSDAKRREYIDQVASNAAVDPETV